MENITVLTGNLVEEPTLRYTSSGVAVCNLRMAVSRRVKNANDSWESRTDGFYTANLWRELAENTASLPKGCRIVVIGRLVSRSFENRDGNRRTVTEIEATDVAASCRWATVIVAKATRDTRMDTSRLTEQDVPF